MLAVCGSLASRCLQPHSSVFSNMNISAEPSAGLFVGIPFLLTSFPYPDPPEFLSKGFRE